MANKVMTALEARVAEERWADLEQAFANGASQRPPQLETAYLVQAADDPSVWRLIGIWRSREALEQYRQSVTTVAGVLMFQSAGAAPTLSIYEVKGS